MNKKDKYIVLIIILLVCLFVGTYIRIVLPQLTNQVRVTNTQTIIYYLQLVVGILLGGGALYIASEQIKISNRQFLISKRQNKINLLLYYMTDTDKIIKDTHKMFIEAAETNSKLTEKIAKNLGGFKNVKKELGEILDDIAKEEFDE